jgi:hypothetical protein
MLAHAVLENSPNEKCPGLEVSMRALEGRIMHTQITENQTGAHCAPKSAGTTAHRAARRREKAAHLPLLDGTYVIVTAEAKEELAKDYGITGGRFREGEVQVWVEGRIVNCGKVIQRSASYVSLRDVQACWVYRMEGLLDDAEQVFVLKDGNPRNLLMSNITVSPRRPEYL